MYRILKSEDHKIAASRHRGINFVRGKGKVWNSRSGVEDAILDAIRSYCSCFDNDVCFDTLTIHDIMENKYIPVADFVTEDEKDFLKKALIGKHYYNDIFDKFLHFKGIPLPKKRVGIVDEQTRLVLFEEFKTFAEHSWTRFGLKSLDFSLQPV